MRLCEPAGACRLSIDGSLSHLRHPHADPALPDHKARNVTERLAKPLQASVRRALRQAWELDDADKAERLLRHLARRLDQEAPGVAASILEGLDEMLTVNRLGLPLKLRRSLACTNCNRKHDGDRASCLSQREAMANCRDGVALDRRRHVGGGQSLPSIESLQAPAGSQSCTCSSSIQVRQTS